MMFYSITKIGCAWSLTLVMLGSHTVPNLIMAAYKGPTHLGPGPIGPTPRPLGLFGPRVRLGPGPVWAQGPLDPGPLWPRAHLAQGPFGPRVRFGPRHIGPGRGWGRGAQGPIGPWAHGLFIFRYSGPIISLCGHIIPLGALRGISRVSHVWLEIGSC